MIVISMNCLVAFLANSQDFFVSNTIGVSCELAISAMKSHSITVSIHYMFIAKLNRTFYCCESATTLALNFSFRLHHYFRGEEDSEEHT